jgi:hypothetical protein
MCSHIAKLGVGERAINPSMGIGFDELRAGAAQTFRHTQ